jgi:hypothetical protein
MAIIRKVNIFPSKNLDVKLGDIDVVINGPTYHADLTNAEIYQCIVQKATVYEVFVNGETSKITLANIKEDLAAEQAEVEKEKETEKQKLEDEIAVLNSEIESLKDKRIFATMADAVAYATSSAAIAGEDISVLVNGIYKIYTINTDKTLTAIGNDKSYIFATYLLASTYGADTTKSRVGEILSVYDSTNNIYRLYTVNTDRSLSLAGGDDSSDITVIS